MSEGIWSWGGGLCAVVGGLSERSNQTGSPSRACGLTGNAQCGSDSAPKTAVLTVPIAQQWSGGGTGGARL